MSFWMLILKNLLRQPVRAGLTLLGISIGITTVVALGVITAGLEATAADVVTSGGADFMVAQRGTADLSFSTVSESEIDLLEAVDGVDDARGALFHIIRVGSNPFFLFVGKEMTELAAVPPPLVSGSPPDPTDPRQVLLGVNAAEELGVAPGDPVTLAGRDFVVVGVYATGGLWEDGGAYGALAVVQEMASKPGTVTVIHIFVEPGVDPIAVADRIDADFPTLTTILGIEDYGEVDQGFKLLGAVELAISILAVGIGAIGVTNTMVMSVFERTREIGILRAIGWSGSRVFRMILGESIVLCVAAALVGSLAGIGATRLVLFVPEISGLLEPRYTADIFVRALIVSVGVALTGAIYPALRAVRLTPMEALRYE
ncbi:MAG TPA: ABC transporter permease [Tepidiformaceae bacterium]|nr:ABC transporter permease [Tepidiformaceae bacterium]